MTTETIHKTLIAGITKYFKACGASTATLGLSGGLDSAVVLPLAVDALGYKNVRVLLMPSQYSTNHSLDDAIKLADNLQVQYDIVEIEPAYKAFESLLQPIFKGTKEDVTEENLQARIRAVLLMSLSNKFGHFLLNTSNKSELAMGYGTLYGDLCGAISVLGDVYKTQVYDLANYYNRDNEIIPRNITIKPPSAELRHGQMDTDSLPPYSELDPILIRLLEQKHTPEQLITDGLNEALVNRVSQAIARNSFKAYQIPPIIKVTDNPLLPEWKLI